ncbi:MAG: YdcF family protein [Acidimicrobiales bacterium]
MSLIATLTGFRLLRFLVKTMVVVIAVLVVYLVVTGVQVWLTSRQYLPRPSDAIVVMGSAQYNGIPSPDLAARLDEAELLWKQRWARTIMVTGYKQPGDLFTEAEASARYLEDAGIPASDILQAGGIDSWENLSGAAPELLARGDRTVLMVTDPFHEDRSMAIATTVGLIPTPTPTQTSPIKGTATVPYFAKEAVAVALGRIVGYQQLSSWSTSIG